MRQTIAADVADAQRGYLPASQRYNISLFVDVNGGPCLGAPCFKAVAKEVLERFGRCDIFVNNVAIFPLTVLVLNGLTLGTRDGAAIELEAILDFSALEPSELLPVDFS